MDVLYFLKERTRIIRQYYDLAVAPFIEIIRKIEAHDDPYIPPYSEDGEPPYLEQWIEAGEMREITGRTCVSMLSASLQLYFMAWEREGNLTGREEFKSIFKKKGFVAGYRAWIAARRGIDWSKCPADLDIIEQVVLARNRDQHPDHIATVHVQHEKNEWKRFPMPFFISEREADLFQDEDHRSYMTPSLHISRDLLMKAIDQVECLCEWLEEELLDACYPNRARGDGQLFTDL